MYHIHVKQALKILIEELKDGLLYRYLDSPAGLLEHTVRAPVTAKDILDICDAIEKRIEDNG